MLKRIIIVNIHFSTQLGGSEIQCHQIAEELSARDIEVIYLAVKGIGVTSKDFGYSHMNVLDNGDAIARQLVDLKPDIVYWRYNKKNLFVVVSKLKLAGIPLVFSASNAYDLKPFRLRKAPELSVFQNAKRYLGQLLRGISHFRALKKVSGIVCNNADQLTWSNHHNKIYIPNSPFLKYAPKYLPYSDSNYVVWVGNVKYHKRPELFLKLADKLVHLNVKWLMIGEIGEESYQYILTANQKIQNFHFLGRLTIEETNSLIKESKMLVHTGGPEGFPNVFLQAWGFGKPVVSLFFDPAGLIKSNKIGLVSGNFDQMKKDIEMLLNNDHLRNEMGENAIKLIDAEFVKEKNVEKLISFCERVLNSKD